MPYLPREPKPGQPIRASDLIALIRYCKAITPHSGPDLLINGSSDGWTAQLKPSRAPRSANRYPQAWPWKAYGVVQDGASFVRVNSGDGYAGSIAVGGTSLVAQVNSTPITTPTPPAGAPLLSVGDGDEIYMQLALSWADSVPTLTSLDIYAGTTPTTDMTTTTPATIYKAFAKAHVSGSGPTLVCSVDNYTTIGWSQMQVCWPSILFW